MPMTHAPETGARKLASVSGASVIQSGAEFFWRQILESDRTCSISQQNLATTWSKYWFVIGQWSMLLFSFVGVVNFVCILDYWNYLTYSVYLTWVGQIAKWKVWLLFIRPCWFLAPESLQLAWKTGARKRRQFSVAGFWSVCLWH